MIIAMMFPSSGWAETGPSGANVNITMPICNGMIVYPKYFVGSSIRIDFVELTAGFNSVVVSGGTGVDVTFTLTNTSNGKSVKHVENYPTNGSGTYASFKVGGSFSQLLPLSIGDNVISLSVSAKVTGDDTVVSQVKSATKSNAFTIKRITNSSAPASVSISQSAVSSPSSVTISWASASSDSNNPVVGYTVYYSDDSGETWGNFPSVPSSTTSQVVPSPVDSGKTRIYFVRANALFNTKSMDSDIVSCSYGEYGMTPPSCLKISSDRVAVGDTVTLSWAESELFGQVESDTGLYEVEYFTDANNEWHSYTSVNGLENTSCSVTIISNLFSVGTTVKFRVWASNEMEAISDYSNVVTATVVDSYACYSSAVNDYYWTNNSFAVGSPVDGDGKLTLLSGISSAESAIVQENALAQINTSSVMLRTTPGLATSGTNWDTNVFKISGATVYLNSPEQYICYGSACNLYGSEINRAKLFYVTDTASKKNINKLLFADVADNDLVGGSIVYGNNNSIFRFSNGLTIAIKKIPFGANGHLPGEDNFGCRASFGDSFPDGSEYDEIAYERFVSAQSTRDGYPVLASVDGEYFVIDSCQSQESGVNSGACNGGLLTSVSIGVKTQ